MILLLSLVLSLASPKALDASLGQPMLVAAAPPPVPASVVVTNGGIVTYTFSIPCAFGTMGLKLGFFTNLNSQPVQTTNYAFNNVTGRYDNNPVAWSVNYPADADFGYWRVQGIYSTNGWWASTNGIPPWALFTAWSDPWPAPPGTNIVISWIPPASTQIQTSSDLLHWNSLGSFVSPITNPIAGDALPHWFRGGKGVKLNITTQ